jgi:formylglycine-generating enzyme required for sulfatase activity
LEHAPPFVPESAPWFDRWIRTARALIERLPEYQRRRDSLPASDVQDFERRDLVATIANIEHIRDVQLPRAIGDLKLINGLKARSIEDERSAWQTAIQDIGSSTRYESIGRIAPQLGLVPIRKDPDSGLWEFWHIATGDRPAIDPDTGDLIMTAASGIVLVLLPGGSFWMGSHPDDPFHLKEERRHRVTLTPFFMGKFEVTHAQWNRIMSGDTSAFFPPGTMVGGKKTTELHPMEGVSWIDCVRFARRLALNLPTEAQWEYACRGGTESTFVWGNSPGSLELKENLKDECYNRYSPVRDPTAAQWDDGYGVHAPVGTFVANPFGLFDVQGNVCEWTADGYVAEYPEDSELPGTGLNPLGTGLRRRVFRGASWFLPPAFARSAFRQRAIKTTMNQTIGLRVARRVTGRDGEK